MGPGAAVGMSQTGRLRRLDGHENRNCRRDGDTGQARGRRAVRARARGARAQPQLRVPVDLTTGEGLGKALDDCAAVVDASNTSSAKRAAQVLVEGSRRLLAAEQEANVGHHVCVSIVGCDRVPMGYYKVKIDQEQVVQHGPVPWSIVQATQFHELVAAALAAAGSSGCCPFRA